MLELRNISKRYERKNKKPVKALRDVSLSFGDTGFNFIVGRSGGGKTTLLNILSGIDTPTCGEIVFDGVSLSSFKRKDYEGYRNEIVGTVFQEYYLVPYYNVGENVKIALDMSPSPKSEEEKNIIVNEYLRKVGLIDEDGDTLYDRDISELSGGQKQRVAIARAMIKKPRLLLCDEPTGALDEKTGKEIFELLRELSKECLVIVVTHDESFARTYGDRLIRIDAGQISEDSASETSVSGEAQELHTSPGKLSFKQCLKIGARAFLYKRVSRAMSVLVVALALIVAGISIMNLTLNETYAHIRQAYDSGGAYITIDFFERIDYENEEQQIKNGYPDEAVRQKLKEYGATPIGPGLVYSIGSTPLSEFEIHAKLEKIDHWGISAALDDFYWYSGSLEVDENTGLKPDSRFKDPSLCRLPSTVDEIAISDIRFELYKACGLRDSNGLEHIITKPDDLIGLKVESTILPVSRNSYEFTICGVFETPDSERIRSHAVREETYDCMSVDAASYGIANYVFVCPDFYELRGYEFYLRRVFNAVTNEYEIVRKDTSRYYLPLTRTTGKDYKFLKAFSYEKDGHTYGFVIDNYFYDGMSVWSGFVEDYGYKPFIIVTAIFAFFAVLVSFGFLLNSVSSRKKEFGVLLSLGISHSTVRVIFFIECMMTALIELVAAYIGMWIVCAIINSVAFHTIYFTAGLLPLVIIFAGSIVFTGIASIPALLPLERLGPKDIVNKAL